MGTKVIRRRAMETVRSRRTRRRLPRLLRRYVVAAVAIALTSVLGAVWLSTTTEFSYDLSRANTNLDDDSEIYDLLITWAGTHHAWNGVQPSLEKYSATHARRIALVDFDGRVVADTEPDLPRPEDATSTLDPLTRFPGASLDPRVTGAFTLTAAEKADLGRRAAEVVTCLDSPHTRTTVWDTGRTVVDAPAGSPDCGQKALAEPVPTERRALDELQGLIDSCELATGRPPLTGLVLDFEGTQDPGQLALRPVTAADSDSSDVQECLAQARVDQAAEYTAPAVRLVTTDLRGDQRGLFDLSPGSKARIALVVVGILLLVLGAATIIVLPTLRGIRALTTAVEGFAGGDRAHRVRVRQSDEVAQLAVAFNRMSDQIGRHEADQRRLLSDVAHELRNPLTNIRGWIEAADDGIGLPDDELRQLVHSEALRLQAITNDLQTLALAEAGDLPILRELVDAAGVVRDIVTAQAGSAAVAEVSLVAEGGPVEVEADAARLRQVVENLVANALRHTDAGGRITITSSREGQSGVLSIADTGSGIAEEDLPRIFDRLWRGDPARARTGHSTGLGLSIARGLVEAMGGTIEVNSRLGVGTTFTVRLPLQPPA